MLSVVLIPLGHGWVELGEYDPITELSVHKEKEILVQSMLQDLDRFLLQHPELALWGGLGLIFFLAWLGFIVVHKVLLRGLFHVTGVQAEAIGELNFGFVARLSNIIPALIISFGIHQLSTLPELVQTVLLNVCNAYMVLMGAMTVSGVLTLLNQLYQRQPEARHKPIKGYIQVLKIAVYAVAVVLMIAALLDKSPLILLSGLGAMAAVLMLVFQDTILSLVASVQISSNDVIRVGDWVEMPQLNADGDVIDIALHTVKIQNWDKTITTIPTRRFMTDPFKNWRGMQESGGRRIKRSLLLDQQSVSFLSEAQLNQLRCWQPLTDYLDDKQADIAKFNQDLTAKGLHDINGRRLTNLGTFRAYVRNYLQQHSELHPEMTKLVRQLPPSPDGLPLEIYCFTATTSWEAYENIQADIFDHLLAILPSFGLRVAQRPTGHDVQGLASALKD